MPNGWNPQYFNAVFHLTPKLQASRSILENKSKNKKNSDSGPRPKQQRQKTTSFPVQEQVLWSIPFPENPEERPGRIRCSWHREHPPGHFWAAWVMEASVFCDINMIEDVWNI